MCPLLFYSQLMVKSISKIKLLFVTKVRTHLLVLSKQLHVLEIILLVMAFSLSIHIMDKHYFFW